MALIQEIHMPHNKNTGLFSLVVLMLLATLFPGCTPRQKGATAHGFYASGLANFSISVSPPLTLAASGVLYANVPSDINLKPSASFTYAAFTDTTEGEVSRHVHTIFSELPQSVWRWEMETWSKPQSITYTKMRTGGKNWVVQIMPVTASTDWFSELWRQNERQTPEFWLAKRWSARPEEEMKVVAEYREPAPLCMQARLESDARADKSLLVPHGRDLWRGCDEEIEAFSRRADQAVSLDRLLDTPEKPLLVGNAKPEFSPDMAALVGRAEHVERRGSDYND